jgi:hypothetical protein
MEFAAFKDHVSLFGSLGQIEKKLSNYNVSHRGTLQFAEDNPVPESIIKEIVLTKVSNIDKDSGV